MASVSEEKASGCSRENAEVVIVFIFCGYRRINTKWLQRGVSCFAFIRIPVGWTGCWPISCWRTNVGNRQPSAALNANTVKLAVIFDSSAHILINVEHS